MPPTIQGRPPAHVLVGVHRLDPHTRRGAFVFIPDFFSKNNPNFFDEICKSPPASHIARCTLAPDQSRVM